MVLVKLRCPPGEEQGTLSVRISTTPQALSLKALKSAKPDELALAINIHIRCTSSTQPGRALTICTSGSVFDTAKPGGGPMDSLAQGALGAGLVRRESEETARQDDGGEEKQRKILSLGYFKVHRARQPGDDAANLRERPDYSFVTVPSHDSGDERVVSHALSAERLFVFADGMTADDLGVGEEYCVTLREAYVGTTWWCWGDLDGELADRKFHAFAKGDCITWSGPGPSEEEMEEGGWIIGDEVSQLKVVIAEGGGSSFVRIEE